MYTKITDTGNAKKLPIDQDAWLMFFFSNHEIIRLHLAPGQSIENHKNEWRIVFYVISGTGVLDVEGRIYTLTEQQSIAVEAGKHRFWSNKGNKELELLVIKTREEE